MWTAAEPIAKEWLDTNLGLRGRLREAGEGAEVMGRVLAEVPRLLQQAERTALSLAEMARTGWRLDTETVAGLAAAQARHGRWTAVAIWIGALSLLAIALYLLAQFFDGSK
jgi:ubiquinone biosynthesis protein